MKPTKYTRNLLLAQTKFELIKLFRMPVYIITLIGLPLFFYMATTTNKAMPDTTEGIESMKYLVCTLGTFGVFGISLFGFGVSYSIERAQGWYHTLQPAPVNLAYVFFAKIIACFVLTGIGILFLFAEASFLLNVSMPFNDWVGIFFTLLLGSIPLACMGIFIGSIFGSNSVSLATIMIYLAIASLSGLLATLSMLRAGNPKIADMAVIYPTYHVAQLALSNLKAIPLKSVLNHIVILICYSVAFSFTTLLLFKKNLNKSHG